MDPIADMFSAIKNAQTVEKEMVVVPYSKIKLEIIKLLQKEDYVKEAVRRGKKSQKSIEISLFYKDGKPVFRELRRISKPSRRVYSSYKEANKFIGRRKGIVILSTPKGVLSGRSALREKAGGEVIGIIY